MAKENSTISIVIVLIVLIGMGAFYDLFWDDVVSFFNRMMQSLNL